MPVTVADLVAKLSLDLSNVDKGVQDVDKKMGALTTNLGNAGKRIVEIFTGIQLQRFAEQLAESAVEALKMARTAELAQYAFENLARQAGVAGAALVRSLEEASGKTISVSDSLAAAARGLQQGLQPEQITRLMEIARSQSVLTGHDVGSAFNEITEAIAN